MRTPYEKRLDLVGNVLAAFINDELINDSWEMTDVDLDGWFEEIKPHLKQCLKDDWGEDITFLEEN